MRSRVARGITKEEKVAAKIARELSDFTLDLDSIAFYIARATPYVIFRRALEVLEACEYHKDILDQKQIGETHDKLF